VVNVARGRLRWATRIGIAGYWLMMFIATHLPPSSGVSSMPVSDKSQHLTAFFLLGLLLPLWNTSPLTVRRAVKLFLLIITYAALDELLQAPVGRTPEWLDWVADAVGACVGLSAAWGIRRFRRASAKSEAGPSAD